MLLVFLLVPHSLLAYEEESSKVLAAKEPEIKWVAWGAHAFDRAKTEDKLILLD